MQQEVENKQAEEQVAAGTKEKEKRPFKKELRDWIVAMAVALAVTIFVTQVLIVNSRIPSASMENTILTGDRVIGLRTAYWFKEIERGDILIFKYPDDESSLFVKRVIGLPGDTVEIKEGKVYINGSTEPLDEWYLKEEPAKTGEVANGVYEVPENSYFMLGDNRNASMDARYWNNTYVTRDEVIGEAWLRIFPKFTFLK